MIKTIDEYEKVLMRIEEIFDCEKDSVEFEELEQLVSQVEIYEKGKYPIGAPSAEVAGKFRAEQEG